MNGRATALALAAITAVVGILLSGLAPYLMVGTRQVRREQLTFFYQEDCARCARTRPLVAAYARHHPDLPLQQLDSALLSTLEVRQAYDRAYRVPEPRRFEVPALFAGDTAYVGEAAVMRLMGKRPGSREALWQSVLMWGGPGALRAVLVAALMVSAMALLFTPAPSRLCSGTSVGLRLLLGGVLLLSGVWKLSQFPAATHGVAAQWHLPHRLVATLVAGIVTAELGLAAGLLSTRPRRWAVWGASACFSMFLAYAVAAKLFSVRGDCGCFPWDEALSFGTIARNFGFSVLAYSLVALDRRPADASPSTAVEKDQTLEARPAEAVCLSDAGSPSA